MEKKYFSIPFFEHGFLQIGNNYSPINLKGNHSYACSGQDSMLYVVDDDFSVKALVLKGGYLNRIKTSSYDESLLLCIEYWNCENNEFSYEFVDVL